MILISRRRVLTALVSLTFVAGAAVSASARPINRVVAFGDSLSDNGNLSALTGGQFPSIKDTGGKPAYAAGRLTNGPVWVEGLASALGVPLDDRAFAGALTNTQNTANPVLTSLGLGANALGMQTQVSSYLTANPSVNATSLFVLWGGANDYFTGSTGNPVANLSGEINSLATAGATQFLVLNLPDLGSTPGGFASGNGAALNTATALHNAGLNTALGAIRQARPTVDVKLLDINALYKQVIANPAGFGLANVATPYVQSGSIPGVGLTQGYNPTIVDPKQNANGYLYYDEIHPTAATHNLIAQRALATVVPEGGTAGLLGFGGPLLGMGTLVRRRRKAAA